jgi:hypothetical protein
MGLPIEKKKDRKRCTQESVYRNKKDGRKKEREEMIKKNTITVVIQRKPANTRL